MTKHAEVLKGKGFNTELEKALRQTLTLLSDPKSTLDAYTKAADALIGHPQPGLKKLGLVMMALGGAVAVALATLTGVGAVAVAAVSIAALTSGGLGLFAGQRTGLSKIAMDLGVAAVKAEKAPEPARPAV